MYFLVCDFVCLRLFTLLLRLLSLNIKFEADIKLYIFFFRNWDSLMSSKRERRRKKINKSWPLQLPEQVTSDNKKNWSECLRCVVLSVHY